MSFPGEIVDLYAEGAARMTATINEKNDSRSYSQPLWKCQVISFACHVRVLNCAMLNIIHLPCRHIVIIIITK